MASLRGCCGRVAGASALPSPGGAAATPPGRGGPWGAAGHQAQQRRRYSPYPKKGVAEKYRRSGTMHDMKYAYPTKFNWSKQHHRIRMPRPLTDGFDLELMHPQKEWWRERRVAPETFFGYPDVAKFDLRGGSLYVEKMDSVTLAVLADRCLKEKVWNPEIWTKFAWRAQQLVARTQEPDLCYIFRSFSRMDWLDQNLLTTYLGRLRRRLENFQIPDVAVLLEAFENPKFRQSSYLKDALTHLTLLLQHRDDAKVEDLARSCAALAALRPLQCELRGDVLAALGLLAEALLLRELSELGPSRLICVLECYASWGLIAPERTQAAGASLDLCWAVVRELKGRLAGHGPEHPGDLARLALALATGGLAHEQVWEELSEGLRASAHLLSGPSAAAAAFGSAKAGVRSRVLFEALSRRLCERHKELGALDCSRAAWGLLRGSPALAEKAVLHGPVRDRVLQLGLPAFGGEELALLLGALARAPPGAAGVEAMASALLEQIHTRLGDLTARQLCSVARSLGYLRPEAPDVLAEVLGAAQAAAEAAHRARQPAAPGEGEEGIDEVAPRHVAMLLGGIAAQPPEALPDAPARLRSLLPLAAAAASARTTAQTAAQLLGALPRCPDGAERAAAVEACAARLAVCARDLPARSLVSLAGALAALSPREGGAAPGAGAAALLAALPVLLDIKRYDLPPGVLWRAARALEHAGAPPGALALEPRDQPDAAAAR